MCLVHIFSVRGWINPRATSDIGKSIFVDLIVDRKIMLKYCVQNFGGKARKEEASRETCTYVEDNSVRISEKNLSSALL
jgi:hypothetical protein